MCQQERHRIRLGRTDVQEMNIQTVDTRAELAKAVKQRLAFPPIIICPPMIGQGAQPG